MNIYAARKTLFLSVIAVLAVVGIWFGFLRPRPDPVILPYGFSEEVTTLKGQQVFDYDEIAGESNLLLLFFWSADCPWCERQFETMQTFYNEVEEIRISEGYTYPAILVVGMNHEDSAEVARKKINSFRFRVKFDNYVGAVIPAQAEPFVILLVRSPENGEWFPIEQVSFIGYVENTELIWSALDEAIGGGSQ